MNYFLNFVFGFQNLGCLSAKHALDIQYVSLPKPDTVD